MKLTIKYYILLLFFFKIIDIQAITLNLNNDKKHSIDYYFQTFEDKSALLTFEDVKAKKDSIFNKSKVPAVLDYGFTNANVWAKLDYISNNNSYILRIENTAIYSVEYYILNSKGNIIKKGKTGINVSHKIWEINHHFPSFELPVTKNEIYTLIYKASSPETLALNMSIKSQQESFDEAYLNQFLAGIYYGMIIIMVLYNLFVFISLKEKSYLFYVLYISATCVGQFNIEGRFFMYVTPNNPTLSIFIAVLCFGLILVFAQLFIRSFIPEKYITKWQKNLFNLSFLICLISILFGTFLQFDIALHLLYFNTLLLFLPLLFFTIYRSYFLGFLAARFLLVGWTSVIFGALIFTLSAFNILNYSIWSVNSFLIGTVIEVLFLSFALGDRINILRQEKDNAVHKTIIQLQENTKLLSQLNIEQKNTLTAFIKGEERERTRLSKELHDSLGQILAVIKMQGNSFLVDLTKNEFLKKYEKSIINLNNQIDEACVETRNISYNLIPILVKEYGLHQAMEELIRKHNEINKKINIKIIYNNLTHDIPKDTELIIYRVIQESISNITKHSQASEAYIQLLEDEKKLYITIEDNGIGFDVQNSNALKGMGLENMRSRVEYLNGKFFIESDLNKGTHILLEIPI
ncbi:MAG: hypothetical protein EAZ27_06990 [Cytophagales bacterium]|nr:MAG: hypothetical protein EAZ27_06990 [Cytophagales bacterium]